MRSLNKFKVGDEVMAYGLKGTVTRIIDDTLTTNTVRVCFDDGFDQWFTPDGKADPRHKDAVLESIVKPKRKVKKQLYVAVSLNSTPITFSRERYATTAAYLTRHEAEGHILGPNQIVQIEIEVEE
jgi:hypothetical protein